MAFDPATVTATATVTGVVNLVIGGLLGTMVKQWIQRRDQELDALRQDVVALRDERVSGLERAVQLHEEEDDRRHEAATQGRRTLHQDVSEIQRTFMHKRECQQKHADDAARYAIFQQSVMKLERVGERTDAALEQTKMLLQEIIKTEGELRALAARVEGLTNG